MKLANNPTSSLENLFFQSHNNSKELFKEVYINNKLITNEKIMKFAWMVIPFFNLGKEIYTKSANLHQKQLLFLIKMMTINLNKC